MYCSNIYKNIYVEKLPSNKVKISSCCINNTSEPKSSIDFFSDPYLLDQREKFNQGIKIKSCNACWDSEAQHNQSLRLQSNESFGATTQEVELLGLDYNVSPLCNAKCIICSSYYSSAWAAEDSKFGVNVDRSFNEVNGNTTGLDLDYTRLQKVYFNGGEPFLGDDMADVLMRIKDQQGSLSNISVKVSTNGSIIPKEQVLSLLKEVRSLTIFFSIDAVDKAFEYIRYPLQWTEVEKNLRDLASNRILNNGIQHRVGIACTVGIHNVLEISKLEQWYHSVKQSCPYLANITLQQANGTLSLSGGFGGTTKKALIDSITESPLNNQIRSWIIQAPDTTDDLWVNYLDSIDQRRGLDWRRELSLSTVIKK